MLLSIFYFIVIFLGIVIAHELGHFIFARLFGVYVTEFSVGIGPKVFSLKGKETAYRLRAIPVGGYVRMAGDDPQIEGVDGISRDRLLYSKKAWKRFLISFAGPLFSIITGYVIMILISLAWGFPEARMSWVVPNSPAAVAGLQAGDRIKAINGHVILSPTEVSWFVKGQKKLNVVYVRNGRVLKTSLEPKEIGPQYFMVLNRDVPSNGRLLKINGIAFGEMTKIAKGSVLKFSNGATATLLGVQKLPRAREMGIYVALFSNKVASVNPSTGLKPDDVILSIDGIKCDTSFDFQNALISATYAEGRGSFVILNENKILSSMPYFAPKGKTKIELLRNGKRKVVFLDKKQLHTMMSSLSTYPAYGNWYPGAWEAVEYGIIRTNRIFTKMLVFLGGLFKTKNALSQFVGPVGLVKMVGQASNEGMQVLWTLIALITLNLGIINLLPLPALDGGHLVFSLIEMISGKRVNPEIEGYIHTVGFFLIMAFFVYITYLDVIRFG